MAAVDVADPDDAPAALVAHLRAWLGAWPPSAPLTVTTAPTRTGPGWDGEVRPVLGVASPAGTVLSVPPAALPQVRDAVDLDDAAGRLRAALHRPAARLFRGVFRWTTRPAPLPDAGVWLPVDDPRVPEWLHPFGGEVLVALDGDRYAAGVGVKRHDDAGRELAVVTDEAYRGRGLAARLVAQAARAVLADGRVPTYLHAPDNHASARTADRAGFPDRGWQVLGLAD